MEKFTVDLDKVLDDFEFNEEQAIRHALQQFKREDLPATKYQKPHFKPINIADADFSPCIETTTMTYPNYYHNHSQGTVESPPESNPPSLDCTSPPHSDLITPLEVTNCHVEEVAVSPNSNSKEEISIVLQEKVMSGGNDENGEKVEAKTSISCSEVEEVKGVEVVEEEKVDEGEGEVRDVEAVEVVEVPEQDTQIKDAGEDVAEEQETKSVLKEEQLPDDVEVSQEVTEEEGGVTVENLDVIKSDIESKEDLKSEEKVEPPPEVQLEPETETQKVTEDVPPGESQDKIPVEEPIVEKTEIKPIQFESQVDITDEELTKYLEELEEEEEEEKKKQNQEEEKKKNQVEEKKKKKKQNQEEEKKKKKKKNQEEEKKKKQSQEEENKKQQNQEEEKKKNQNQEEEDKKNQNQEEENKKNQEQLQQQPQQQQQQEAESKPPRPDSLELKKATEGEQPGSPGLTPLPKNVDVEGAAGSEEESLKNGNKEEVTQENKENKENMELHKELEHLLDAKQTETGLTLGERRLGKVSPFWMPDHLASSCMECESKFTVIKRRHHCRACGRILCSKCCGMRASLEYLQNQEQRVCETCFRTLAKVMMYELQNDSDVESSPKKRPNPNNPMEYCSTVPPPLQVSSVNGQPPPSVMVPVGVLKREGSSKVKEAPKQVMFSDGIRPGGDLTELDGSGDHRNAFRKPGRTSKRAGTPPGNGSLSTSAMLPPIDPVNQSFIVDRGLPPICITNKGETTYEENWMLPNIMERLKDPSAPPLQFAINRNLSASVKIVKLDCCMKETCWVIVTKGMGCVGQDEIVVLLTVTGVEDCEIPKEVFLQFHYIYQEAARGNTVNELGCWSVKESAFLDSKQHGGFLFIRPTFQCLNRIETPPPPFLVGVLIHRSEIPWARVFPFRLMLRLGAEFRYYPCPLVSVRFREPVYYEIGHTIINLLADFRNLSYTIPTVRGLRIHMEANQTSILIPRNRYDQVIRALNNSNDPVLALAGNFSPDADAHLVCMQSKGNEISYSTHAININDKPRKVTGASFVVLNGALKTTSGVAAKSSIVEDGLMVQVPSETMTKLRTKLRNMEDWSVRCGPIEGRNTEEIVRIVWSEDDKNFNVGVKSVIDNMPLDGVPSIRVHSGKDYMGCSKFIRWTQVFIIKCEDGATSAKIGDPLEVNKLSESLARATCLALTKLLELLAASGLTILAVRATIDQDNVGYEAGSNGEKLAPIYMNSLDNELIPVLHKAASVNDSVAVLELMFHIMDQ